MKEKLISTVHDPNLSDEQRNWIVRQRKSYIEESKVNDKLSDSDILNDDDWDWWDECVTRIRHKIWNNSETYDTQFDSTVEKDSSTYRQQKKGYYVYHANRGLLGYSENLNDAAVLAENHCLSTTIYDKDKFNKGFFASRTLLTDHEFKERQKLFSEKIEYVRHTYYLYHFERGFIGTTETRDELNRLADNHIVEASINKKGMIVCGFFASTRELTESEIKDWCSGYNPYSKNKSKEIYLYNRDGLIEKMPSKLQAIKKYGIDFSYVIKKDSPTKGIYASFNPVSHETLKTVFSKPNKTGRTPKPLYAYTKEGLYKKFDSRTMAENELGKSIIYISIGKKRVHKGYFCSYSELTDESVEKLFEN